MRKACSIGMLILMMIGSSGCLFEPRTPDHPSGTDEYPWVSPNVYPDALHNLTTGFASNVDSNFQRSLDESFTFLPTPEDETNLGADKFANWTKAVELEWLRSIKTLYLGARTLHFGDANGAFPVKIETRSQVILEGEYQLSLEPSPGAPKEVYAGIARFTLVQSTQGWVMSEWKDISASGTDPTAGYLRGTLRQ
jgi:hypothetical protein